MPCVRPARLSAASLLLASLSAQAGTLLSDDFSDPSSGWPNMAATRDSDLGFAVYTDGGQYQLTPVKDHVFGFIPAPRQASGGDMRIEADLFLYAGIGAGAAGLGCRFQDHRNFYAFMARGDAMVAIVKVKDGEATPLAQARVESVVPGTVEVRLGAQCVGDTLTLEVQGSGTIRAQDGDFASGQSGLFVIGESMAGTSGAFDDVVLSQPGD